MLPAGCTRVLSGRARRQNCGNHLRSVVPPSLVAIAGSPRGGRPFILEAAMSPAKFGRPPRMQTQSAPTRYSDRARAYFAAGHTRDLARRKARLQALREAICARETQIVEALAADLGKPDFEAIAAEISLCLQEIAYASKHLHRWVRPQRRGLPLNVWPARGQLRAEPLGVVLIISPWNYPFQLAIAPLVGAIAAGNCAVVKPSEITPHTSRVVAELIAATFEPEFVTVVEGDKAIAQALLAERWDHIFFTGSPRIGKLVMAAAAEHLTPVTLELGGKSPCIVARDADLEKSARRIVWGKFLNAGQTCVAPDYLLVERAIQSDLLAALRAALQEFYGENPADSPDYARIVSDAHFQRLQGLLDGGTIVVGGQTDPASRYIAPTLLTAVEPDSPLMQEEIFGPLLPVLSVDGLDEAIATVNARPQPLALYIFARDRASQELILDRTSSGGVTINDTIIHLASPTLPFGGVGTSGMGSYRGRYSFDTFSHYRGVARQTLWFDLKLRYPPYAGKLNLIRSLME